MAALVTRHGYPIEEHFVTTPDGYILGMFRIPHGKNASSHNASKPPVLLQHALLDSSFAYVCNLPNESLGYILADEGYDVWFGNNRGNKYSTNHTHLDPKEKDFWKFTYDDMALTDLPTEVDYITSVTGASQISYVGHSEGTIQAFAGFSQNQTLASKIRVFIALAPVAYVYHIKTTFMQIICKLDLDEMLVLFGDKSFLPSTSIISKLAPGICDTLPMGCADILELVVGPARNINTVCFVLPSVWPVGLIPTHVARQRSLISFFCGVQQTRLPVYVGETPSGTSVQNMVHWCQGMREDKFRMYNYESRIENMKHYNQTTPPEYKLADLKVPTVLLSGGHDYLADPKDVSVAMLLTWRPVLMCGVFPSQSAFMNRCNASRRRWSHRPFLNHTKLTTLLTWTLRGLLTPLMKCTLTSSHTWVKLQRCPFNPSSSQTNPPQHSTFCGRKSPNSMHQLSLLLLPARHYTPCRQAFNKHHATCP